MAQHALRTSPRRFGLTLTIVCLLLAPNAPAWAWGRHGHRIVAKLAATRLKPAVLAKMRDMLDKDEDLASASNWADEHRTPQDTPWHYVNVPLESQSYDAKFCDPSKGCVVEKLKEFMNVLKDPNANHLAKRQALRFVIHLVADIHQPFHVASNNDRGGNLLQVRYFGEGTNLHAVWDFQILEFDARSDTDQRGPTVDEDAWVTRLAKLTTPARLDKWSENKRVENWADESLQLAKEAYKSPTTGKMIRNGQFLACDYQKWAIEKVEQRLAQAGVRLADILNNALDSP
ncbi:MAG: S1/P1 nuclease [Isosphaeraceae bacterium]